MRSSLSRCHHSGGRRGGCGTEGRSRQAEQRGAQILDDGAHHSHAAIELQAPFDRQTQRRRVLPGAAVAADVSAVELPLYGRIAAGTPIEALRDQTTTVGVPANMLSRGSEHYALEVAGDSMIDAGILDGDIAVIKRADGADTGDIVVALIDEEEATLKRFRRRGASIALEPANTAYEVRILPPNRVRIQGKLVGLFRKY